MMPFTTAFRLATHTGQCRFSSCENLSTGIPPIQVPKQTNNESRPMSLTEVAVHMVTEQHGTPRIRVDAWGTSTDEMHEKPNGLGLSASSSDEDVERGV
jgi:hypothetical protein